MVSVYFAERGQQLREHPSTRRWVYTRRLPCTTLREYVCTHPWAVLRAASGATVCIRAEDRGGGGGAKTGSLPRLPQSRESETSADEFRVGGWWGLLAVVEFAAVVKQGSPLSIGHFGGLPAAL